MVHIYTHIYTYNGVLLSQKKRNEILPFAATWMNPEIILNDINWTEKKKYFVVLLIYGIQKSNTNESRYKIETDSQT